MIRKRRTPPARRGGNRRPVLRRVRRGEDERRHTPGARRRCRACGDAAEPAHRSVPAGHRIAHGRRAGGGRRGNGGRVIATPVERGTRVTAGTVLVRISGTEADAQLARGRSQRGANRGAARRWPPRQPFDPIHVPEVMNAKASLDWAEAEFNRIKSLLDQKVVSQSEYDQRSRRCRRRASSTRPRRTARSSRSDRCSRRARARRPRAQGVRRHVVRAPFAGLVAERLVSTGDYVTRGTKVVDRREDRSAPRGADGSGAIPLAGDDGQASAAERRRLSRRDVRREGAIRLAGVQDRSARADSRSVAPNADGRLKPDCSRRRCCRSRLRRQPCSSPLRR